MNPILQLKCSLLGYPGQLARPPLPVIPTSWSVAFWPVGWAIPLQTCWKPWTSWVDGTWKAGRQMPHLRSLWPRTCGCHGSLRLGRPVAQMLGRKLKDLFRSKYLNRAAHCHVLMVWWVDHTSRVVIIMCWVSNSCWVVIIMCWISHACWVVHDLRFTSVHERGENRSERQVDMVLCAGAAARRVKRGLNFIVWNFAWDRLASGLYAATAKTILMKFTFLDI